ncbi:unnamed protein product [Closterium sp. NIES-53]
MTRGEPASGSLLRRRTAATNRYPWSTRQCLVCVLAVAALNVLLFHLHGDSIEDASRGFRALILESSGRRGAKAGWGEYADWEGKASWDAAEGGVGEGVGGEAEPTTDINMKEVYDGIKFANEKGGKWTQGWKLQYKGDEWDEEPLRVFVVPHSHNDPGWLLTVEQYYTRSSQHILHTILQSLSQVSTLSSAHSPLYHHCWYYHSTAQHSTTQHSHNTTTPAGCSQSSSTTPGAPSTSCTLFPRSLPSLYSLFSCHSLLNSPWS